MPEQLALEQLGSDGATVDRHEGAATPALIMQKSGHELFARSCFALDQHRRRQGSDPLYQPPDLGHGFTFSHQDGVGIRPRPNAPGNGDHPEPIPS